ncbi:hypothetical protein F4820DRAFT_429541 [Hypoxylon rubiginosum]|uniref:Uncharacterized protein n=1 Tax=Hypoxylon rubiginosum TaxID=110542 RepID=A0ACB9YTU3_9PEZI|nr:hypothetical protein F4820DRAFT_429541 [Hypoxylon rubiginosum]
MHSKSALALAFASGTLVSAMAPEPAGPMHEIKPRQTTNPGGPVQSISEATSATDEGTTGVLSIQTDTSSILLSIQTDTTLSRSDSSSTATVSSASNAASSSTAETSAALSSSVSDAGAAPPRETGFALGAAAAAAVGFAGVVAAL